ncbi:MAG: helix-turn-helix domain-containing protein [Clostridia bacterium]|nr:helix-turn-helix domain-containing protein [Spirochaetia bacterium]
MPGRKIRRISGPLGLEREVVLNRAAEAARQYSSATGVNCIVLDEEGRVLLDGEPNPTAIGLCGFCTHSQCRNLHLHAATQARRFGGSFVYLCPLGFMHWASPLYLSGRSVGVLVGGPVLAIDSDEALASMRETRPDLDETQLVQALQLSAKADPERVHSLSQLMARLAEQASSGGLEEFEASRRKTEQQSRISEEIHEMKQRLVSGEETSAYPLEKERTLLAALRRGDETGSRRILNELLGTVFFASSSRFELVKFRAIELLVLLSRAVIEFGRVDGEVLGSNYRNIQRIQDAADQEELADILNQALERFSRLAFSFREVKHAVALRKAEKYIRENFMGRPTLTEAAAAAGLSPAYFSSVFKEELGESFSEYLNRLRVELAAELLVSSDMNLAEVAGSCGFDDQSWFTKVFKLHTGMSPGRYRKAGGQWKSELDEIHE